MDKLFKRTSFVRLLKTKYDCEIKTLKDGNSLKIIHGPASAYLYMTKLDRIDYDEIYLFYQKLCLPDLPSPSELEEADDI